MFVAGLVITVVSMVAIGYPLSKRFPGSFLFDDICAIEDC